MGKRKSQFCLLVLTFCFTASYTQSIRITDNKGTIKTVSNGISNWTLTEPYAIGQFVIQNNKLYKANAAIPANTTFIVDATGSTWTEVSPSSFIDSTINITAPTNLAATSTTEKVYIDPGGSLTVNASTLPDGFSILLINHSGSDNTITFSNFQDVYDLNRKKVIITTDGNFSLENLESVFLTITENSGNKFLNVHRLSGDYIADVTNETIIEDVDNNHLYISMVINGEWIAFRYDIDDPNNEVSTNESANTGVNQPITLAEFQALTYN